MDGVTTININMVSRPPQWTGLGLTAIHLSYTLSKGTANAVILVCSRIRMIENKNIIIIIIIKLCLPYSLLCPYLVRWYFLLRYWLATAMNVPT